MNRFGCIIQKINSCLCFLIFCSCVNYVPEPEDAMLLRTALAILRKFERHVEALRIAIRLNDMDMVEKIFIGCTDK